MAGESLTKKYKRAKPVRPDEQTLHEGVYPIIEESGDAETEEQNKTKEEEEIHQEQWDVVAEKVDGVTRRVAEYLDDDNAQNVESPPVVKAPTQPTRDEYERHQTTHTVHALVQALCRRPSSENPTSEEG